MQGDAVVQQTTYAVLEKHIVELGKRLEDHLEELGRGQALLSKEFSESQGRMPERIKTELSGLFDEQTAAIMTIRGRFEDSPVSCNGNSRPQSFSPPLMHTPITKPNEDETPYTTCERGRRNNDNGETQGDTLKLEGCAEGDPVCPVSPVSCVRSNVSSEECPTSESFGIVANEAPQGPAGFNSTGELTKEVSCRSLTSRRPSKERSLVSKKSRSASCLQSGPQESWYHTALERSLNKRSFAQKVMDALGSNTCPQAAPDTRLSKFFDSSLFSTLCAVSIIANTVLIAVNTDAQMRSMLQAPPRSAIPSWYGLVEKVFTIYFTLELWLRLIAQRLWFFASPEEWKWNAFDVLLVISSIFQHISESANVSFLRTLRIFRVVRIMRLIRLLRFFRELRKMLFSILACMASLAWAFLLLFLIMFMFSLFFMQGASGFLEDSSNYDAYHTAFEEWYPNLFYTMFSLLLAISGGTDWLEVVRPLEMIHWSYQVAFAFYVMFVIFGVVNVLTGVFLENAAEFVDRDLMVQSQLIQMEGFVCEMIDLFHDFDPDHEGRVSSEELHGYLQDERVQAYLAAQQLDCTDAATLMKLINHGQKDEVDLREFVLAMLRLRGQARSVDIHILQQKINKLSRRN